MSYQSDYNHGSKSLSGGNQCEKKSLFFCMFFLLFFGKICHFILIILSCISLSPCEIKTYKVTQYLYIYFRLMLYLNPWFFCQFNYYSVLYVILVLQNDSSRSPCNYNHFSKTKLIVMIRKEFLAAWNSLQFSLSLADVCFFGETSLWPKKGVVSQAHEKNNL